jgi:hypothetical protein
MAGRNHPGSDRDQGAENGDVDVCRLAELVASGEARWPADLDPQTQNRVAEEVRRIRTENLLGHLARLIAASVQARKEGDRPHVEVPLQS